MTLMAPRPTRPAGDVTVPEALTFPARSHLPAPGTFGAGPLGPRSLRAGQPGPLPARSREVLGAEDAGVHGDEHHRDAHEDERECGRDRIVALHEELVLDDVADHRRPRVPEVVRVHE